MSRSRVLDAASTATAPMVWGSTYIVTTETLPPDSPLLASLVRALPAGLFLVAVSRTLPSGSWWWKAFVLGVLNIGVFLYLLFVAAYHLPGGVAALVIASQPILVLVLAALLLNESVRRVHVAAAVVGTAGVALLVLQPGVGMNLMGVAAAVGGAVSMAVGVVLTKRWGRPEGVGVFTFTGWQLSAGGLFLLPPTLLIEGLPDRVTGVNVAGFAYLGVIGALLAYALWFRGIERLPATAVSFLGLFSPLAAAVLGYLVLGEALSPTQLAGALGIVGAVVVAQSRPRAPGRRGTGSAPHRVSDRRS